MVETPSDIHGIEARLSSQYRSVDSHIFELHARAGRRTPPASEPSGVGRELVNTPTPTKANIVTCLKKPYRSR